MIYQVNAGIYSDAKEVLGRLFSAALPILAGLVLVGLFSYSSQFARGTQPVIAAPENFNLSVKKPAKPTPATAPQPTPSSTPSAPSAPATGITPSSLSTTANPLSTPSTTTVPTTGGLGGGDTTTTDSSGLLPATITTPPLDLQAADKQILSTGGTSITIN